MNTPWKRWIAASAAATVVVMGAVVMPSPAQAEAPNPPVAEFNADLCAGSTDDDPRNVQGEAAVPDLTRVFGSRLDDFNSGLVVPLYDTFGANELDGYPAVCGVRHVEGVGAVSEWMFCTDYFSHVCSGVNENGELVDIDGNPIPGVEAKPNNPKLSSDQEKLISWLISNGHDYEGTGYFNFNGVSTAVQDSGSYERAALQVLVWCISDPVPGSASGTEGERAQTCADNMGPEEQSNLLAQIPEEATITLQFDAQQDALEVGDTAEFELTTNLYNQPIRVSPTGIAGTLEVVAGDATYDPASGILMVTGSDPSSAATIRLAVTGESAGTVSLSATAQPASPAHIAWNQSPGIAADGVPCQVFATFSSTVDRTVTSSAQATFIEDAAESEANADAEGSDSAATAEGTADGADSDSAATANADADGTADASDSGVNSNGGNNDADASSNTGSGTEVKAGAESLANTGGNWSALIFFGALLLLAGAATGVISRRANVRS